MTHSWSAAKAWISMQLSLLNNQYSTTVTENIWFFDKNVDFRPARHAELKLKLKSITWTHRMKSITTQLIKLKH